MAELLELLNEVSPDNVCGEHLEYDPAYLEFAKNILGKPEDLITGEKAQPPNWRDIQKDAIALLRRTKDIQIAVSLLRALIHLEGITGFRDGLNLLQGLLEKYWENIHPILDPDDNLDPTIRVNIIEELSNFDSVLWPLTLSPLVDSKLAGRFCLRDIHLATDKIDLPAGATKPDIGIIKAAFNDLAPEVAKATHQAITESSSMIKQLDAFFNDKVGVGNGPNFSPLTALLNDLRYVFEEYAVLESLDESAQTSDAVQAEGEAPATAAAPRQQSGVGEINSRQDVLKALDLIFKYYAEKEPSSPVPILLQRAKLLVTSDFMQIVENLLPDGLSQLRLIKGPDPDGN